MLTEEQMKQLQSSSALVDQFLNDNKTASAMARQIVFLVGQQHFSNLPIGAIPYANLMFVLGFIAREEGWDAWEWE